MSYTTIRENLLKPFNPREVLMRVGNQNLLLAYTDIRTYQDRLHEVASGLWSESNLIMVPAGNRTYTKNERRNRGGQWVDEPVQVTEQTVTVGLTLTVAGVSMVGVSDPDTPTSAYAQAFKRACANHGLGAYFYRLPKVFQHQVSMDDRHNVLTNVLSIVVWCYDQAGLEVPADVRQEVESLPENLRFNPQARQASSNYRSAGFQPRVQPASPVQRPATQEGQPGSMSEKQLNVLRSAGFLDEELQQMIPAHAKYIIGMYFANREQGIDALRAKWYELIAKSDGRA